MKAKYYKRDVSLMDTSIYPRSSLDKPIDNPDAKNSTGLPHVKKSNKDIVKNVVAMLRKTGTK